MIEITMTNVDAADDYAIEVPDRGWVTHHGWPDFALGNQPTYGPTLDEAIKAKERIETHYRAMGCPEIASTVRIMTRSVTVTRGEWEPLTTEELHDQS